VTLRGADAWRQGSCQRAPSLRCGDEARWQRTRHRRPHRRYESTPNGGGRGRGQQRSEGAVRRMADRTERLRRRPLPVSAGRSGDAPPDASPPRGDRVACSGGLVVSHQDALRGDLRVAGRGPGRGGQRDARRRRLAGAHPGASEPGLVSSSQRSSMRSVRGRGSRELSLPYIAVGTAIPMRRTPGRARARQPGRVLRDMRATTGHDRRPSLTTRVVRGHRDAESRDGTRRLSAGSRRRRWPRGRCVPRGRCPATRRRRRARGRCSARRRGPPPAPAPRRSRR